MVRQLFWSKVKAPRRRNARKASDTLASRISRDGSFGTFSARVEMLEGRAMLATYSQGDFAILAINSANPDSFTFTNLKAMDAGDAITFTDNGFTAGTTARTGEGFLTFTAPAGGVAAGSRYTWTNGMTVTGTPWSSNNPTNFALNGSGDQLFIFSGTSSNWGTQTGITLLFGMNIGAALSSTSSAANTVQPTALTTAWINLPSTSNANTYYSGSTSSATSVTLSGTTSEILTAVTTTSKWFGNSGTAATFPTYTVSISSSATPSITGAATATAFTTTYGTASAAQTFNISGSNLTANLVATAPTGFEVSSDGTTYGSATTFTQSGGSASGSLSVRLKADAAVGGSYNSQNIVLSSTGTTNVNITTSASGNAVSAKGLTITGLAASDKGFDGTTTVSVTGTPTYSGLVNGESFSVTDTVTWAFPDSAVGANKTLTRTGSFSAPSSNYTVTQPSLTASITAVVPSAPTINSITAGNGQLQVFFSPPSSNGGASVTNYKYSLDGGAFVSVGSTSSPFTITGLTNDQAYSVQLLAVNSAGDGAASTAVSGTPAAPLSPQVTVSGLSGTLSTTYGTASAEQSFTVSGSTLSGDLTVSAPTGVEVSATSGAGFADSLVLTATSGSVANTTIYVRLKATAAAGAYNNVSIAITGGGDDKSVATSGTDNIVSQKALTITGIAIANKEYDQGTSATITGTAAYSGLANGESFSVTGTPSASFADKNVATGKAVTVSGYTAPSSNYTISQPTGLTADITAKALTIDGAAVTTKTYNGTTAATITGTLAGVIAGDTVSFTGTGSFASANAGTGIAVASTSTLGGTDAANYTLTQPTGLTGDIMKASQTITFGALPSKTVADGPFTLAATTSSGLTITYASSDPSVAEVSGNTVTIKAIGSATITASQAGDGNYDAATSVSQSLTVLRQLAAGDIAIIALQTDDPDEFAFVALATIEAGQSISFTDNAWSGSALATNESTIVWTAPSGGVAAGTVVTFANGSGFSVGSSTGTFTGGSTSGDQVIAYVGTAASPTFLYALSSIAWISTGTPTSNTSYLPSSLVNGETARDFSTELDNQYYSVASTSGTKAAILASIGDVANWTRNNTRFGNFPNASSTFAFTQPQTVTFNALSSVTYGDSTFELTATASSGLDVTYVSSNPTVASISGSTVTILKAGSTTIIASQAGNSSFSAATPVAQSLTVSRKGITVTADGQTKTYGSSDPVLTYVATGLVGGDTLSGSLTRAAGESVAGGPYAITQGGVTNAANANYDITFVGANLSVTPKALAVTANNASKVQGQTLSGGAGSTAFTSSGLVSGDAIDSVAITYTSGGDAEATAGTYTGAVVPSAATGSSFAASNYSITYVAGDLTVSASPTISVSGTLSARSATYGSASTAATFIVSGGFLSGDLSVAAPAGFELSSDGSNYTLSGLTLTASGGTVGETTIYVRLAAGTATGTYSGNVSVSGGGATTQTLVCPSSTVSQKSLSITGLSASGKTYDGTTAASVSGTPVLSGVVGSDDVALDGTASFAFATAAAGSATSITTTGYSLTGAAAGNYSLSLPPLLADISQAPLTITGIAIANKAYDGTTAAVITGTAAYSGLVNGETFTVTGTPTAVFADAAIGTGKSVTVSGYTAPSGNYSLTQPSGLTADITKASQTITFNALSNRTVAEGSFTLSGSASSGLTVTYSSSDTSVATVAGTTVTILKAGKVTITASQAGDDNYDAATSVSRDLFILGPGSILFTGINTTNPDQFSFVAMHDLPASLAITFTDNAWSGTALGTTEGNLVYTTPVAGGLAAGSRVVIERSATGNTATIVSGSGTVGAPGSNFTLGASGDNVFSYTGTSSSPNFLAGVLTSVALTTGSTTSNLTYVPTAIGGQTVQVVSTGTIANSQYIGSTTGIPSLVAAALVDRANWGNSATALTLATSGFTFIDSQVAQSITFDALAAKTYGDAAFSLDATASSGLTVSYVSSDPTVATISGSTVTILKAGTTTITASQAGNPQYSAASSVGQVLTVSAKGLTITADGQTKTYGSGDPALTYAVSGLVGGDTAVAVLFGVLSRESGENVGTYAILQGSLASTSGNYTIDSFTGANLTVSPKALVVTGAAATGRVYDGTTTVAVAGGTLSGVLGGDTVTLGGSPTGSIASKNVGTGKAVTVTGYALEGTSAGNYSITQPSDVTVTIAAAPLSITGASATDRQYNGSTTVAISGGSLSGVIGDDDAVLGGAATGRIASANAGTGKAVTVSGYSVSGSDAGNYSLTQPTGVAVTVTPRVLSISAPSIASRVYNGTTTPGAVTAGEIESSGFVSGQTVVVSAAVATAYASANVGSQATTVSYTLGNGAGGGLASNYSLAPSAATGVVTAKALTITANNVTKSPGTTLTGGPGSTAFTSSGLVAGESIGSVSITYGEGAAANAESDRTYSDQVVPSAATGGTFAPANYAITYRPGDIVVSGSPSIVVGGTLASFATTYGSAVTQTLSISGANLGSSLTATAPSGFQVSTDGTTFSSSVTITPAFGVIAPVTLTVRLAATTVGTFSGSLTVAGGGSTTRTVSIPSSTVARKALTVSGATAQGKTYDGSRTITITGATLEGVVGSDAVTVSGGGTVANAAAGAAKAVTTALVLGGANAGNYKLTQPTGLTVTIAQKALTLSGAAAQNKTFDGTTAATITGTLAGVVSGDSVAYIGTGAFAQADRGTGIVVTPNLTLYSPTGSSFLSYTLTQPTGLTADITTGVQSIDAVTIGTRLVGTSITMPATTSTGRAVTYSSDDATVASVAGTVITFNAAGFAKITASASGTDNFAAYSSTQTVKVLASAAAVTLGAGDVVVLGYNAVANTPDYISFLFLRDLTPGTRFFVSDNEVTAAGGTQFADLNEAEASFTVKAGQVIAAGTVLTLPWQAKDGGTGVTQATDQYDWVVNENSPGLNQGGDEIYVYNANSITDKTPTSFIYGVAFGSSPSQRPTGLVASDTFIRPTGDTMRYKTSGATYAGAPATLRAAIGNTAANWESADAQVGEPPLAKYTFLLPQPQLVTFAAIDPKTYGDASFAVSASAFSGGSLTYASSDPTVATVDASGVVSILKAGSTTITASVAGNDSYLGASASQSLTVARKAISVAADAKSKTYGHADPALTYLPTGLVGSDTLSGSLARAPGQSVGTYAINVGTLASPNYEITAFTGADLTVTAKALTITAGDVTKAGNQTLANGSSTAFTASGLVTGETVGSVTITYGDAGAAGYDSGASGTYTGQVTPSAATGGTFTASNYSISYVAGSIIVNSSPTISVSPTQLAEMSTTYGTSSIVTTFAVSGSTLTHNGLLTVTAPTGFQVSLDGTTFASSRTISIDGSGVVGTTTVYVRIPDTTAAGSYGGMGADVTVSGGGATAKTVATTASTVAKKELTISGLAFGSKTFDGTTNVPTPTAAAFAGFVNGDTGTPSGASWAFADRNVGADKPLVRTGAYAAPSANYTVTQPTRTATITAKTLSIAADPKAKTYGNADPTLTFASLGLVAGDSITGNLSRAAGINAGTYAINQGSVSAGSNYAINFTSAHLTIAKRAVTVTADALSKVEGQADPTLSWKLTGGTLASGDTVQTAFTGGLSRAAGESQGLYTISQGSLDAGNYAITFVGATFTVLPAATPLKINGVFVKGDSWSAGYQSQSVFTTVGSSNLGWSLADGTRQLTDAATIGWNNVNVISIRFNQPISQPAAGALNLVFGGSTAAAATTTGLGAPTLLEGGTVAQWTLPASLATGKYRLVATSSQFASAASGTNTLDGEWTAYAGSFAAGTGNGTSGGDFAYDFDVLVGNAATGDKSSSTGREVMAVNLNDNTVVTGQVSKAITSLNFRCDVNGDGKIDSADQQIVQAQIRLAAAASLTSTYYFDPVGRPKRS